MSSPPGDWRGDVLHLLRARHDDLKRREVGVQRLHEVLEDVVPDALFEGDTWEASAMLGAVKYAMGLVHFVCRYRTGAPPDVTLGRDELQVRSSIYLQTDNVMMAVHELGHALADTLFYRSVARQSGYNWVVGYSPFDVFAQSHVWLCEDTPVLVRQSEELAILCARAFMRLLGVPEKQLLTWLASSNLLYLDKSPLATLLLELGILELLQSWQDVTPAGRNRRIDWLQDTTGWNPTLECYSAPVTPTMERCWEHFFDYYRVRPGQEDQFRRWLRSSPGRTHMDYLREKVRDYGY